MKNTVFLSPKKRSKFSGDPNFLAMLVPATSALRRKCDQSSLPNDEKLGKPATNESRTGTRADRGR